MKSRGRFNTERYGYYLSRTIIDSNGCMIWQGGKNAVDGYGTAEIHGDKFLVHRYIALANVEDPEQRAELWDTAVIMHTCDVRSCINPDHLRIGTAGDNMHDAFVKGKKDVRGEKHPSVKVTEEIVRAIRAEYAGPRYISQYKLAKKYGLKQPTISAIILRRLWPHVE